MRAAQLRRSARVSVEPVRLDPSENWNQGDREKTHRDTRAVSYEALKAEREAAAVQIEALKAQVCDLGNEMIARAEHVSRHGQSAVLLVPHTC